MEVHIAAQAGFCFGVKRAIDLTEEAAAKSRASRSTVATLGPLIHNAQVVARLREQGVEVVDSPEQARGTLVVRTHGAGPEMIDRANSQGLGLIDATCPYVTASQRWAKRLTEDGYQVIVVGEADHPEIKGILGWSGDRAVVVETPEDADGLPYYPRAGVIAQTTFEPGIYDRIVEVLKTKAGELKVIQTICRATEDRQAAARDLASRVDVMLVVGGRNSGNTARLFKICREACPQTYWIETAGELKPDWFEGMEVIGITAGASTPDWIIKEVATQVSEIESKDENQEPAAAEATETMTEAEKDFAQALTVPHHGDIIKGKVVQVNSDSVMVDVGYKSEGVIPLNELSHRPVASPDQVVKPGDEIMVYVLGVDGQEGSLRLSKRRADEGQAWGRVKEAFENQEFLEAEVVEVVKGGLVLDIGLRGFMPASQVDRGYVADLGQYLGQQMRAKIIELDRHKNRVILSRKAVIEAERHKARESIWSELEEGQIRPGTVKSLTEFGAFVDLGGVDGLIHISELSWGRVKHPSDVLKVGDKVEVKVLRLDREKGKVSLGYKQAQPDPWSVAAQKFQEGSVVTGKVVRLTAFGAFVELEPGIDGLIHISQLADRRIAKPDEVVNPGQEVKVRILSVNPGEKRISLSLKDAEQEAGE